MVAQALDKVHHVRGDNDSSAGGNEATQNVLNIGGRNRVDRFEGLIENQHGGRVNESGGERNLLGHTGGVVGDGTARSVGQVHCSEQILDAGGDGFLIDSVQVAGVGDELLTGELVEEVHAIGQHAQVCFGFERVGPHVNTTHVCGAFIGHEHTGDHGDGGGFTGTVAADQSVEGSGGDVEVDTVDGDLLAECLGEAADFNGGASTSRRYSLRGDG